MGTTRQQLINAGCDPAVIDAAIVEYDRQHDTIRVTKPMIVIPGEPQLIATESVPGFWWQATWSDWRPASKNEKAEGRWVWHRARERDNAAIALWASHWNGPERPHGKRRVLLTVERKRAAGSLPDPQNLVESCADSLVVNKLIRGDSGKWLSFPEPMVVVNRELSSKWRTTIKLEDI